MKSFDAADRPVFTTSRRPGSKDRQDHRDNRRHRQPAQWKSRPDLFSLDQGAKRPSDTPCRSLSQVETYVVGEGTWGIFSSPSCPRPDKTFDRDIVTMRQIASSFKVNDQAVAQVTQNMIAANNQRFARFRKPTRSATMPLSDWNNPGAIGKLVNIAQQHRFRRSHPRLPRRRRHHPPAIAPVSILATWIRWSTS